MEHITRRNVTGNLLILESHSRGGDGSKTVPKPRFTRVDAVVTKKR